VTSGQVPSGVGLILVLAVGSRVLASRLRIPALIIGLPAGWRTADAGGTAAALGDGSGVGGRLRLKDGYRIHR
jgi:hypothetical protein